MLSFFTFSTYADGTILPGGGEPDFYPATEIVADFIIEETVGDEFFIKSGDLTLRHLSPIRRRAVVGPSLKHWLLVTFGSTADDPIIGVYSVPPEGFEDYDHLTGIYTTRLKSAQQIFYEDLASTRIQYTTDTTAWAQNLPSAIVSIENLTIVVDGETFTVLDQYGFLLKEMLKSLTGRHNDHYYLINLVNIHELPGLTDEDNAPIIFRGESLSVSFYTPQVAINYTFSLNAEGEVYNLFWKDFFDLAAFCTNGYIRLSPNDFQIQTNRILAFDITLTPRQGYDVPASPSEKDWHERRLSLYRYKIDGVHLQGKNFEFTQGIQAAKLFERLIDISDPARDSDAPHELYMGVGNYNHTFFNGFPQFSILSGGGETRSYFREGLINPFYADLIASGHGYAGKITYNGELALDFIKVSPGGIDPAGDIIQLNKISISPEGIATIEGAKV